MIFADNPHDKEIEKMMQKTPHFRPRGHGIFVSEKTEYNAERCGCRECADRKKKRRVSGEKTPCVEQRIHEGQIPQPRVLMETFTAVTNPEFIIRINGYIKESEKQPMQFRNEKHRSVFENAIKGMNTNNKIKMCALYLLTADGCLWSAAKRHIGKDEIHFFRIKLGKSTPTAYTLFCCAKDLALGSKHMTISDLADGDVVSPKDFAIICKMIKLCKRGKVDMIITKSISRFARNTLDCLKYTRMLKAIGVDVFFEEQGIHSTQPGAEFYITIYGSIAQSESENISANVKFGKAQSAREGNVAFHYKNFLGYRKGEDGKPEIVPEEAETVRFIYESFLAGDSIGGIKAKLEERGILSPSGKPTWNHSTIVSILTNEKYTGDAIINKTFIEDCISKKVKVNNGERQKFYVENNHPAIIDRMTFARVQEELARRNGKLKVKQVGTKTEQGKYSSKYALTELLVCGECKTPYRRCTWTVKGKKKIVWRCISRLDYGKKYCHESPTIEESVLQEAIMNAIMRTANENAELLKTLKLHIGMGLDMGESEDESLDLQIKIAEIDAEFKAMLNAISSDTVEAFDEQRAKELMDEKSQLQQQLAGIAERKQKRESTQSRLDEIFTILDGLRNRPMDYDDRLVRQILECVVVESKERIKVVFIGGLEITENLLVGDIA